MEAINRAIEGASDFSEFMNKLTNKEFNDQCFQHPVVNKGPNFENRSGERESRSARRQRERFEAKQASRLERGLA